MNRLFGSLVTAFVLILVSSYMWSHRQRKAEAVAVPAAPIVTQGTPTDQTYDKVRDSQHAVTSPDRWRTTWRARSLPTSKRSIPSRRRNRLNQLGQLCMEQALHLMWPIRRWAPAAIFCIRCLGLRKS